MNEWANQLKNIPIDTIRSRRVDEKRVLTSGNAGKILPIAAIPLLREDALVSGRLRVSFEMMETAEQLMNGINVQVNAYFVPWLAFDRFEGSMDRLNRSYAGQPAYDGGPVTPWFLPGTIGATYVGNPIMKTLGCHTRGGAARNVAYAEAYNCIVNHRRKQRSKSLPLRLNTDTSLAEAFWLHTAMKHIVPDFDQALIDGEVALNITSASLPVKVMDSTGLTGANQTLKVHADGQLAMWADQAEKVWAELASNGVTVSLSNIDLAKKTAAFARMRQEYQGHDDDWIIDMLMSGIRLPEQALREPVLMQQVNTLFGYSTRFASDGANLDESVTVGATYVDLNLRLPRVNTGGIIMVTAEIVPEQLFERQKDHFLHSTQVGQLPEYLRDYLDPEKVSVVQNQHVDMDHTDPTGTFGYAPLNHEWMRSAPNIGGKYYRPAVNAPFDEDRQKIWAVETVDPELTADFYLCTQMHQKVFADTVSDAFEIMARGQFVIEGNTVFGAALHEATDDYDAVMAKVDQTRVVKP
ncbi:hypothetical protein [Albidovulum sp.]|uniref:hypothetical protein n=1 Tax=Albidovulum sp. TaxID=1872424 RepID=UPI0039B9195B